MSGPDRPSFLVADGGSFAPLPIAAGPWGSTMRGRLLGALAARSVEDHLAALPGFACTRLTLELFRAPKMEPVTLAEPRLVRDGARIKVLDITVLQNGEAVSETRAVLLRRGEQPEGPFRAPPTWDAAALLAGPPQTTSSRHPSSWDSWSVSGTQFMGRGLWVRERHDLVAGEPLTPLVRAALTADLASPVSNDVEGAGLPFINADYTLYLGRQPRGEHLGVQPYGHISDTGLAAGLCVLHDHDGPVGFIGITALANPRPA